MESSDLWINMSMLDTRQVNKFCVMKQVPANTLNALLRRLGRLKPKYFCTFDFYSSYFQLGVTEDSYSCFMFINPKTNRTHYLKRLPQGYINSSQSLQECLSGLFQDIPDFLTYADDCLLSIKTFEQGMISLGNVLDKMIQDGLVFNFKKCVFFTESTTFVGQVITNGVFGPMDKHVNAIKNLKPP